MKKQAISFVCAATLLVAALFAFVIYLQVKPNPAEGPVSVAQIEVGPFDIHRRYRSMEGPYVSQTLKVGDMLASKKVVVPEALVQFTEKGNEASMIASKSSSEASIVPSVQKKTLYWVKGINLQVLDENDRPLPTAEFICHLNLDVSPRNQVFKKVEGGGSTRLFTLTQGQTDFHFPEGFAVPVSSDELWHFTFQAANRTTSAHRRVKHLCTVDFIKDSDLKKPLQSLSWYAPYIAVVIDKNAALQPSDIHGPGCLMTSTGQTAPNMVPGSTLNDARKRIPCVHEPRW